MGYQETSAKTGKNVGKSFTLVIDSKTYKNSLIIFLEIYDELKGTIMEPPNIIRNDTPEP